MKKVLLGLAFVFAFVHVASSQIPGLPDADAGEKKVAKVTASIVSEVKTAAAGQAFRVAVKLVHAPHHHTYGKKLPADGTGVTTSLAWELPDGWKVEELPWPEVKEVASTGGEKSLGYDGTIYLPAKITPAVSASGNADLVVKIKGLVCDPQSCMPFTTEAKFSIPLGASVEVDPAAAEAFGKAAEATLGQASAKKAERLVAALVSEMKTVAPGKPFRVAVRLDVAKGFHTYGKQLPPDAEAGLPTSLEWSLPEGWKAEELPWPTTHEVPSTNGKRTQGYDGTVFLPATITPSTSAAAGVTNLEVKVTAVVCDEESCQKPRIPPTKLALNVGSAAEEDPVNADVFKKIDTDPQPTGDASKKNTANGAAAKRAPSQGVLTLILFAFIGGLILNVMPCVFPVLGIKVLSIVRQSGEDRGQVVRHGLVYTAGVLVCFWILAGLVIALGKGWGFQLQNPGFVFGLTCFFVVFAMNMAGVFEIGSSAVGVGAELQTRQGLGGSFFSGLLAVVVATPCSAPFLAPALTYALSLPAVQALLMFTVIGLGLASPFLVLSAVPGLVSKLPRPGVWMESFKQGMSFLLFGTAGYMIAILAKLISAERLISALLGVTLVAFAMWVYGRWCLPHKPAATRFRAVLVVILSFGLGVWYGWPRAEFEWEKWSPDLVEKYRAAKEPVYVDFTAIWCATCQVNHRLYDKEEVQKAFLARKVHLLKADWSKPNDQIQKALDELGESAIPVNLLYVPNQKDPIVLPKLLSVENLKEALNKLP